MTSMTTNHADVHTSTTSRAVIYRMLMPEHICPSGPKALYLLKRRGFEVKTIFCVRAKKPTPSRPSMRFRPRRKFGSGASGSAATMPRVGISVLRSMTGRR